MRLVTHLPTSQSQSDKMANVHQQQSTSYQDFALLDNRYLVLFVFSLFISSRSISLGFLNGSKMISSGSSHFRCLLRSHWCNQRSRSRDNGCHSRSSLRCHRDIGSSNSKSIDVISNIVDGLKNSIGINILVTSSGHSKSILGFSLG